MFNLATILISSVFMLGSTSIGNPDAFSDSQLKDRLAITDVVNSVGTLTDLGIPEYVNGFNLASWEGWLTYDAVAIGRLRVA